jgi:hypothetical protein
MSKKLAFAVILILCALPPLMLGQLITGADSQYPHLSDRESQVVSLVNGTNAYNYDLELEKIALDHNLSDYAFRSAGSQNANRTANWIKSQFGNVGLEEVHLESFEFTAWNLPSQPTLIIDEDGNPNTTDDQTIIKSFECQQFSWPTPENGTFSDLVVLPLSDGVTYGDFREGKMPQFASIASWNNVNTTGKIVLIGREANWYNRWSDALQKKIEEQRPVAIIYTYWYDWMNFTPPFFGSMAGTLLWNLEIPTSWVNYDDGLWIRNREKVANLRAIVKIPAVIGNGTHYNVVGKLTGKTNPDKYIIISGHYDTVMDAGFCDNGAGTAGVIELARIFSEAKRTGVYTPDQTLIFVAFTGEELGFVGAIDYVKEHNADMKNINAVINLDSIGHDLLTVSETFTDSNGLKLDEMVINAAQDLGVNVNPQAEDPGGSDQEAFRNPVQADILERDYWGIDPNINGTVRVQSSTMLGSFPLFYSDKFATGTPGWIHTEYDNSTSTVTLGWVTTDALEGHIRVAALSVTRVLAALYNPFMSEVTIGAIIAAVALVALALLERSKFTKALAKVYSEITWYIDTKELVTILLLTGFLLFSSYASQAIVTRAEVIVGGVPTVVNMRAFGYPFEMIEIPAQIPLATQGLETLVSQLTSSPETSAPRILWIGLILNTILFFLLAFGVTYLGARLWEEYSSRKPSEAS